MSNRIECPPESVLKELIDGKVDEPQLSELSHHVEDCGTCQEVAKTLSESDTLVQSLRLDPATARKIANDIPQPLIEKVKDIARREADARADTMEFPQEESSLDSLKKEPEPDDTLDFLAPPQQPDEIGRLGAYRILKVLGKGGMGVVLLADDTELDRQVALKVMLPKIAANPSAKQRFLREARTAAKLKSDHIVTIYQVSEDRGVPFLAMERLEGSPLDGVLSSGKPLPLSQILNIGLDTARGLAVAHAKGLIHRDIKPANLWLDQAHGGRVKILDFGLARAEQDDIHLTQSGAIVGTPAYMAPEQARGDKGVDGRADLFSLGCVLYRLAVGDIPFKGETTMGVLLAIAMHDAVPPVRLNRQLPPTLSNLIMQLLEKDPANRPASAREVIERLTNIQKARLNLQADPTAADMPAPAADPDSDVGFATAMEQARAEAKQPGRNRPGKRTFRPRVVATALIGLLLAAGAGIWALDQLGVIRVSSEQGDYVIETDDPDFAFSVSKGTVILEDRKTKRTYNLKVVGGNKATGEHELEVTDIDADLAFKTKNFTIKRGQEVALKAWFERKGGGKMEPATADPDRLAATRALELGASVVAINNNYYGGIRTVADLPKTPFVLTHLSFFNNPKITDAELAIFRDCKDLKLLGFEACPKVTDAGLAHFRNCKNLVRLDVPNTPITDAGLAHFKDCKLTDLRVAGTAVTDAGLAYFKDCQLKGLSAGQLPVTDDAIRKFTALQELGLLNLERTKVTDVGLAHFKDSKKINDLNLSGTAVTDEGVLHLANCNDMYMVSLADTGIKDAGLAMFKGCSRVWQLNLNGTQVTDAGLVHLKDCGGLIGLNLALEGTRVTGAGLAHLRAGKLHSINLNKTGMTDEGLEHLKKQLELKHVRLRKTKVTAEGVRSLSMALPKCKIEWDGGVIEPIQVIGLAPITDAQRKALEFVLSVGGHFWIEGRPVVTKAADIPKDAVRMASVSFQFGLGFEHLTRGGRLLTDEDVDSLRDLPPFPKMTLSGTAHKMTLRGFEALTKSPGLTTLESLTIDNSKVPFGPYFKHLGNLRSLTELTLGAPHPDDGSYLGDLAGIPELHTLNLTASKVTELHRLKALSKLHSLGMSHNSNAEASAGDVASLTQLRKFISDRSDISDAGLDKLGRMTWLKELRLLGSTQFTDKGLEHLTRMVALEQLNVMATKVTEAGVKKLAAALPKCKITWDGGVIEPKAAPKDGGK